MRFKTAGSSAEVHVFVQTGDFRTYQNLDVVESDFVHDLIDKLWDPLYRENIGYPISMGTYFLSTTGADGDIVVRHHRPEPLPDRDTVDSHYASITSRIGHSLAVLSESTGARRPHRIKENSVLHGSSSGYGLLAGDYDYLTSVGTHTTFFGFNIPKYNVRFPTKTNDQGLFASDSMGNWSYVLASDFFAALGSETPEYSFGTGLTAKVVSVTDEPLKFSVTVDLSRSLGEHLWKARLVCEYSVDAASLFYPGLPSTNVWAAVSPSNVPLWFNRKINTISASYAGPGHAASSKTLGFGGTVYHGRERNGLTMPRRTFSGASPSDELITQCVQVLSEHTRSLAGKRHHVYGAAYVSASRAVREFRTVVESNYVETLSDLTSLFETVKIGSDLAKFIRSVPSGRLLSLALGGLVLLANAYLTYRFVAAPAAQEISEFAIAYDRIVNRFHDAVSTLQDLRGKFTYTFGDGPLQGYTLVTRSKVLVRFPLSGPLNRLAPLTEAGVLPSPSAMWDTIPMSFVVDWFTNNSERLELGEAAFLAQLSEVYSVVHSYTLYLPLADIGLPCEVANDALYKLYIRVPSRHFPSPTTNQYYDWLAVDGFPPLATAGALLTAFLGGK